MDTKNIDAPDYPQRAVAELVRCYKKGARGVGELSEKGSGYARGAARDKRLHPDDPRLNLFWKKCAELKIPVNVHMADHPQHGARPTITRSARQAISDTTSTVTMCRRTRKS